MRDTDGGESKDLGDGGGERGAPREEGEQTDRVRRRRSRKKRTTLRQTNRAASRWITELLQPEPQAAQPEPWPTKAPEPRPAPAPASCSRSAR